MASILARNSWNSAFSVPLICASFRSSVNLALVTSDGPHIVPKLPSPVQRGHIVMAGQDTMATSDPLRTWVIVVVLPLRSEPSANCTSERRCP